MAEGGAPEEQAGLEINFATMNIGVTTQCEPDRGGTRKRQERISTYWNHVKPDIVFAQRISAPRQGRPKKWKLALQDQYTFLNADKEAGIAFNSEVLKMVKNIDAGDKDTIDRSFQHKGKLWAAILLHKKTDIQMLCVSYNAKPIKDKDQKSKQFLDFITFVNKMATWCSINSIVIGGNFKMTADATIDHRGEFKTLNPGNYVDYFMYKGPEFPATPEPQVQRESYANSIPGDLGHMDHDPVLADVYIRKASNTTDETARTDETSARLRIVTMKMGNTPINKSDEGGAAQRQKKVSDFCCTHKPDIVFTQEIGAPLNATWNLNIPTEYKFLNLNSEAGVAYNSEVFEYMAEIDVDEIDSKFANKERLWAAILKSKTTKLRLLCVSWHGPNKPGLENNKNQFELFIIFVELMAGHCNKTYSIDATVIGGDFNLDANVTEERRGEFVLLSPRNYIDYFLYKGLAVKPSPEVFEESYVDNISGEPGYLGHNPVRANMYLDVVSDEENDEDTEE